MKLIIKKKEEGYGYSATMLPTTMASSSSNQDS